MIGTNTEVIAMLTLIVTVIASYVKLQTDHNHVKSKLITLEGRQKTDHQEFIMSQASKEKALWDEMKSFQQNLFEIGQSLGRLEGKIDFLNKGRD